MAGEMTIEQTRIHIRYDGESRDLTASELDLGDASTDQEIRTALAGYFGVPVTKLNQYAIDRADNTITVRPQAVFG